jgi:hypothetical protein
MHKELNPSYRPVERVTVLEKSQISVFPTYSGHPSNPHLNHIYRGIYSYSMYGFSSQLPFKAQI